MARRDSRASLNVRQNDALSEFENFKKKFLLANKHITKLNSTLSVRIEELQAEISSLYAENLRLRTAEIALSIRLKKEEEKSRKILADAEAATSSLSKHLAFLRQSLHISPQPVASEPSRPPPPTRVRRLVPDPLIPRLSRAPNFPGIVEDDEAPSSPDADEDVHARRRSKEKPASQRRFASLSSPSSPPPPPRPSALSTPVRLTVSLVERGSKRKQVRRQSGLLSVNTDVGARGSGRVEGLVPPRAASPALGSPDRRNAGLAEDDEEREVDGLIGSGSGPASDMDIVARSRRERGDKKAKLAERECDNDDDEEVVVATRSREKRRRKDVDGSELKDVTNSPRRRTGLFPLDTHVSDRDRQRTPETDSVPTSAATTSRTFLSTPATTPMTTPRMSQLPTPRTSSPVPPSGATSASESEAPTAAGRERRVRKSVNYAEPKLNTKMRKPDPVPVVPTTTSGSKKRTSVVVDEDDPSPSSSRQPVSPLPVREQQTSNGTSSSGSSVKRKPSRPFLPIDDDDEESEGTQADAESGTSWTTHVDGGRRRGLNGGTARSGNAGRTEPIDAARRHSLAV